MNAYTHYTASVLQHRTSSNKSGERDFWFSHSFDHRPLNILERGYEKDRALSTPPVTAMAHNGMYLFIYLFYTYCI